MQRAGITGTTTTSYFCDPRSLNHRPAHEDTNSEIRHDSTKGYLEFAIATTVHVASSLMSPTNSRAES